jgi:pimeloyl-ACP methyl ester carboxylesterase
MAPEYLERRVPFAAGDGRPLLLKNVRGAVAPTRDPVIVVHGAGVRSNIFRAPVGTSIVDALVAHGYDVWLVDWRASIDLEPSYWTLDQAALHDYPQAVRTILQETGKPTLKAVIHCQGSTSFMMSAVAGLLPEVTTVVSNAVSLHPVVPRWSRFKLDWAIPLMRLFTRSVDPHWGLRAAGLVQQVFAWLADVTHRECHNRVCKLVSLVYGSGCPALWSHETISQTTHEWVKEEFGFVPLRFFEQMAACVRRGNLVSAEQLPGLPPDYVRSAPKTNARFALFAGERNLCFLPESQDRTFRYLNKVRPDYHTLHILPRYGHLDMFMSDDAARDVFPLMVSELDRGGST